jgi:hypothetical protein
MLENSGSFKDYLHKHGMDEGLAKHKLKLRDFNRIMPHVSRPASRHEACEMLTLSS